MGIAASPPAFLFEGFSKTLLMWGEETRRALQALQAAHVLSAFPKKADMTMHACRSLKIM